MKILFLISTLNDGGAEKAMCNLTLALPETVEIDILVNSISENDYPHRGNVISLGFVPTKGFSLFYQAKAFIRRISKLRELKKNNGYDACISFMDSANFANIISGNKYCKTVLSERIMLSMCKKPSYRYIVSPLARLLYPMADAIVSVAKGTTRDLVKNYGVRADRAFTIYNGYDIPGISDKCSREDELPLLLQNMKKEGPWFNTVGRLCRQKGQWHLIRAFRGVCDKYPKARLFLCGQGPYEDKLRALSRTLGIEKNVVFLGFCSNPYAIAAKCDAFAFSSLYEGIGNVVIENLACSLPVVTTDFQSGCREILAPQTDIEFEQKEQLEKAEYGIIVPVCSGREYEGLEPLERAEELLLNGMLEIIENEELAQKYRAGARGRAGDFAMDECVRQWLEVVE